MTARSFAPEPPEDIVLPERGSGTSRAIASLALRNLFEWVKTSDVPAAEPGFGELRALVRGFLPGRPKEAAAIVAAPSVSARLRLLRDGRGADPTRLGRAACEAARAVVAGEIAPPGSLPASFLGRGAVVAPRGDAFELAWPPVSGAAVRDFVESLRAAHAIVREALPGVAESLERVLRVVVPTTDAPGALRIEAHAPAVAGVGAGDDAGALAAGLARAAPTASLLLLREVDPVAPDDAFDALIAAAAALAEARLAEARARRRHEVDAAGARRDFLEAAARLEGFTGAFTDVGRGVLRELERHARYPRGPEPL